MNKRSVVEGAIGRRGLAVLVMAGGAAVTIVGTLLPWLRTGGRQRHSYDLFALVGRLGFAPDGPVGTALRWWPLVPLLAVAGVVAGWWGWPRVGGTIGVAAACYAGGTAMAITVAGSDDFDLRAGTIVTIGGAVVLLAGAVLAVVTGVAVSSRRAQP